VRRTQTVGLRTRNLIVGLQNRFLFPEAIGKMRLPPTLREMVGLNPARTASSALACIALIRLSIARVDVDDIGLAAKFAEN